MFGRNTVLKPVWDRPSSASGGAELVVHSIWATIQGEGPHAGEPAIFIRLTGCNLRCHFCDTAFDEGQAMTLRQILDHVNVAVAKECATDLVVLTGGEPMRQQIIPLLQRLSDHGFTTQIETAGTVWPPSCEVQRVDVHDNPVGKPVLRSLEQLLAGGDAEIVCSPKTPGVVPEIENLCEHFKYIIRKGEASEADGLPNKSTQMEGRAAMIYRPDPENVLPTIWLQPMAEYGLVDEREVPDLRRTAENMKECVRLAMKHGHRISLQIHKLLGVE